MLTIINGDLQNSQAKENLNTLLESVIEEYSGTVYYGFALSEMDQKKVIIDALLVTKEKGLLAINFSSTNSEKDLEDSDRIYLLLRSLLEKNKRLRKRKKLAIDINVINFTIDKSAIPKENEDEFISTDEFLSYFQESLESLDESYYEALNEAIDKVVSAKPKKPRNDIKKETSYGAIIKEIEQEIANMDHWQRTAAYELPNKPQRIRGLAGSGKTIVLALKTAYIHFKYPSAHIAVTFYSRSLHQQFVDLIQEFFRSYTATREVDFDKVHVLHAWGNYLTPGLYSKAAEKSGASVYSYKQAVSEFGESQAFKGVCEELLNRIKVTEQDISTYDYILIDEAQDLPPSFFQLSYHLIKGENKRIVYAYDELQSLNSNTMPSIKELFGTDNRGDALVNINNDSNPNSPKTDIVLPVCYRNSHWILTIAHSLGFGVYRDSQSPLVQFFDDLKVWNDIGYEAIEGHLNFNSSVKLARKTESTPDYFNRLMNDEDAVVVPEPFIDKNSEYIWVAKEIQKNIEEDELDPDDILVIFPNAKTSYKNYENLSKYLDMLEIDSIMPGVNVNRDTFTMKNKITCTHIYRAKGNEKPMVYLVDGEYGARRNNLVSIRNTLFTAITRSRAWIRISGVGMGMKIIREEIKRCKENDYTLKIDIPSRESILELNLLNSDESKDTDREGEDDFKTIIKNIVNGKYSSEEVEQLRSILSEDTTLNEKDDFDE